jgi:hypothetical protein
VVGGLLHAHLLFRKDLTQIDLAPLITDAATARHDRRPVVKRIVQLLEALIRARRRREQLAGVAMSSA